MVSGAYLRVRNSESVRRRLNSKKNIVYGSHVITYQMCVTYSFESTKAEWPDRTRDPMTQLSQLAKRNVSNIFNQRNRKKRIAALKLLWTADSVWWSAAGTYIGFSAIEQAISDLLRSYPEFTFSLIGEADEIPEAARIRWSFGIAGASPAMTGLDVIVALDGQIVSLYRSLDGAEL